MYHVSTQGVDERMINVHYYYYYYYYLLTPSLQAVIFIFFKEVLNQAFSGKLFQFVRPAYNFVFQRLKTEIKQVLYAFIQKRSETSSICFQTKEK